METMTQMEMKMMLTCEFDCFVQNTKMEKTKQMTTPKIPRTRKSTKRAETDPDVVVVSYPKEHSADSCFNSVKKK